MSYESSFLNEIEEYENASIHRLSTEGFYIVKIVMRHLHPLEDVEVDKIITSLYEYKKPISIYFSNTLSTFLLLYKNKEETDHHIICSKYSSFMMKSFNIDCLIRIVELDSRIKVLAYFIYYQKQSFKEFSIKALNMDMKTYNQSTPKEIISLLSKDETISKKDSRGVIYTMKKKLIKSYTELSMIDSENSTNIIFNVN